MSKLFYPKLAANSIKKNSKTYFPYILTCIFTIAMYYMMYSIATNKGISKIHGGDSLQMILGYGIFVIGFFSVIFLFYTNSFLIKRRKKEFGLFNILGMEKKHISKMLCLETLYIAVLSLISGILSGILLSKLMYLLLLKILHFDIRLGFEVSVPGIISTLILFSIIFVLILLNALRQIHLTNPIELLKGGQVGEKEPKTKWILATIGIISLGIGYYISITTKDPLASFGIFFIAVIFVIIGTYFIFIAGSIALLKMLRKNKKFYYKSNHFISVSGMIYRMKQNAAGLASICILSTAVLVMLSTTISLYIGMEDVIRGRYARNIITDVQNASSSTVNNVNNIINQEISKSNFSVNNVTNYKYINFTLIRNENSFTAKESDNLSSGMMSDKIAIITFIPLSDYNKIEKSNKVLNNNEVLLYSTKEEINSNNIKINNINLNIKEKLPKLNIGTSQMDNLINSYYIVVPNENLIRDVYSSFESKEPFKDLNYYYGFDTNSSREDQIKLTNSIETSIKNANVKAQVEGAEKERETFFSLYGGLFFLGIFLGTLFIMATVLIIYYKQISEGYDDKNRFEIMQKVGLSKQEVKKSIRSQVLTVFFIPLITAAIHIAFAFNVINKLLMLLGLINTALFAWCTIGTILVFGVFYAIVYVLTAKVYYKIVS